MNPKYPLFVFEKDDSSMLRIDAFDRIQYHLEAIDVENDEYVFWDSTGSGVEVVVERDKISGVFLRKTVSSLEEAFAKYVEANRLPQSLLSNSPIETWDRIQAALTRKK